MSFLEIISDFEGQIKGLFKYELLEMHYVPYSFGSGLVAYRINGRIIEIIFDGKDIVVECKISDEHEEYPSKSSKTFFIGGINDFIARAALKVKRELISGA